MALKLHGARRIAVRTWEALKESKGSVVFTSGNSAEAPKSAYPAVSTINDAIIARARAFRRARHQRWRTGQQRASRPCPDKPSLVYRMRKLGISRSEAIANESVARVAESTVDLQLAPFPR
jgi:hypothetical protein